MYIKFFGNKSGGSKSSVNYLLNERVSEGTAKVLKGNPEFTKAIIGEIKNKHKVCFGSINLSQDENLSAKQKEQIMSDFEKTICPGLSEDEYNILWVEHTDKDRLELNFVIPKIHLPTQKAYNPYYHKQDFPRIDAFEDICNIKYNLSSKKDPSKAQTLLGNKKDINLVKDYKELDKTLHELVQSHQIQNREQLIELLKESDIEVTRTNKEGISVKLPESKKAKRFKGSIYNEQFTSIGQIEAISEETNRRIKEFQSRDTSRELEQTIEKLGRYNDKKAQQNREKYQSKNGRYRRKEQGEMQSQINYHNNARDIDNRDIRRGNTSGIHPEVSRADNVASSKRDEIRTRGRKVHQEPKADNRQGQYNNIHQDRGIIHDTRRRTLERARERARAKRQAYANAREARAELLKSVATTAESIREQSIADSIELSEEYEPIIRTARATTEQSNDTIKAVESINRELTIRERIANGVTSLIERVKDYGTELKEGYSRLIQQSGNTARSAQEVVKYKEQEQSYSHSYHMRR
jgi:hypothetical protein